MEIRDSEMSLVFLILYICIFNFIHLQNEEEHERKESSSA